MAAPRVVVHHGPLDARFRARLTDEAILGEDRVLYVVASELQKRLATRRLLSRLGRAFELPFLTFDDLLLRLVAVDPPRKTILSESEKLMVLTEILSDLDSARDVSAMAVSGGRFISSVKGRNIRDGRVLRLSFLQWGGRIGAREEQQLELFNRYQAFLGESELEDREGFQGLIYDGLLTGSYTLAAPFPNLERVIVDDLSRLSPLQWGILGVCLRSGVCRMDFLRHDLNAAEVRQFFASQRALQGLEIEFCEYQSECAPVIESFSFPQRSDEVVQVAERILSLLAKGSPPEHIHVVCGALRNYQTLFEEVFLLLGVPYCLTGGRPATESAHLGAILDFLRFAETSSSRTLSEFLRSPVLRLPPELKASEGELRKWLRMAGSEERPLEQLQAGLAEIAQPDSPAEGADSWATSWAAFFASLSFDTSDRLSLKEWYRRIATRLLPHLSADPALGTRRRRRENLMLEKILQRVYRGCLISKDPMPLSDFRRWLIDETSRMRLMVDSREGAVWVGSPEEFRGSRCTHLFWIGLVEDEFPRTYVTPLTNSIAAELDGAAGVDQLIADQSRLFEALLAGATQRVLLSRPRRTAQRRTVASPCLMPWSSVEVSNSGTGARFPPVPDDLLVAAPWRDSGGCRPPTGPASVFSSTMVLEAYRQHHLGERLKVTPSQLESYLQCGYRYFLSRVLDLPSRPDTPGELSPRLVGEVIHAILHRFMGAGYESPYGLPHSERAVWLAAQRKRLMRILESELAARPVTAAGPGLFRTIQGERLGRGLDGRACRRPGILEEFLQQQWRRRNEFQVEALERRLGEVPLGAISSGRSSQLKPVAITGTVDRIDRKGDALRIVDYKTGNDGFQRINQGWGFQLPLYLELLQAHYPNRRIEASFYALRLPFTVRLQPLRVHPLKDGSSGEKRLMNYYRRKALQVVRNLHDGRFPITQLERGSAGCHSCEFKRVCRYRPDLAQDVRRSKEVASPARIIRARKWLEEGAR